MMVIGRLDQKLAFLAIFNKQLIQGVRRCNVRMRIHLRWLYRILNRGLITLLMKLEGIQTIDKIQTYFQSDQPHQQ